MTYIDLRSDTVTKPTAEMRRAMAEAEVGDDVYREDPTVNRLEKLSAEMAGKQAALFVPTGTMANNIGIKVNTRHGEEVICEAHSHILDWELSMTAWFSGCLVRSVETADGILRWKAIERAIRRGGANNSQTACIEVENTHNMAGGTVYPLDVLAEIYNKARESGIRVHMDGARIFNAAAALNVSAAEIASHCDTVMFCLSKGLGAPAGSILAGSETDIAQARLYRKRLGGGMRQSGVLAAAGIISLEKMTARLPEDHAHAALLAQRLSAVPGFEVTPPQTNIVRIGIAGTGLTASDVLPRLKAEGVLLSSIDSTTLRAVTHLDVTREDCERAASVVDSLMSSVH